MGVAGDRSAGCAPAVRRRAVTLIEAVLFIAVALAVIVGGLAFYQQASIALTTQKTIRLTSAFPLSSRLSAPSLEIYRSCL